MTRRRGPARLGLRRITFPFDPIATGEKWIVEKSLEGSEAEPPGAISDVAESTRLDASGATSGETGWSYAGAHPPGPDQVGRSTQ